MSTLICSRSQGFYENATNLYSSMIPPMKGHGAIDENCGYGSPIEWLLDGTVSNVLDDKHPASDGYWGIYAICNYKGQLGELCVGHCSRIDVKVGDKISKGQVVGLEGNHGLVFQNGVQITIAQQKAGNQEGHHRHWQWRPVNKIKDFNPKKSYITSYGQDPYKDSEGFMYEIVSPSNGYRGLSPDIAGILNDYEDEKFQLAVVDPAIPPGIISSSLNSILESLKVALKKLSTLLKGS